MNQLELKPTECSRPVCYIRMSSVEFSRLQNMIKSTGISAPELFRRALFNRMDLERPLFTPEQARDFETELKRQGNNINQIAKRINSGLMTGWSQALSAVNVSYMKLSQMLTVNYANR